ncbi:hypothetical protein NPIL_387381 [Nephila pilipes]|uniref:Uncharacterized protein n=1 Tax=Nephila pilipes TaxID=299642 RepID=A0A8X6MNQ5_NEPPI|nr:hypothetical protein NPIL_387381 [Nephila pilipes]
MQSRRKKSTPIKNVTSKKQKISDNTATECSNKFDSLHIDEIPEQIEVDDDEDVTPPPPKKSETRTARSDLHTTPTTYAEAAKSSPVITIQENNPFPIPASNTNINDIFKQLKDPECLEMFGILKKFIAISKSGKSTSERFTEIMALLQIDQLNV